MLYQDLIEIENHLAYEMLKESLTNLKIKQALKDISDILITNVLKPIQAELTKVKQFSDLPTAYQAILKYLAAQHSAEKRQYGAVMPTVASSKEILSSMSNIKKLLAAQENALRNIDNINAIDMMAVVLKIIIDFGSIYFQNSKLFHRGTHFKNIKHFINRDLEEGDIRLLRTELGEPPKFALTFGIGTTEKDLGLQSDGEGRIAGKSIFGLINMKARLTQLCADYDKTQSEQAAVKMAYYGIPLNKTERKPIEVYAVEKKTYFEKLILDPKTQISLPLIASVSGATVCILATLEDLGAFNRPDGSFDFDKAQIIANCLMGFIVHGGHHSTTEVAEVYNRLLDYIAINHLEKNGPDPEMVETKMPYYHIGNYPSFFNKSYVDKLIESEPSLRPSI